jgi:hypothetical protein
MENSRAAHPTRIGLQRRKGYRLQEASQAANGVPAIKVDRSTRWGNPFLVESLGREAAIDAFRRLVTGKMSEAELRKHSGLGPGWEERRTELRRAGAAIRAGLPELRGNNLACWCKENEACHADVLLELANKAS